jgi:hypothetical protein
MAQTILFIILALIAYFGLHWLIFFLVVRLFQISKSKSKIILGSAIFLLSISFVLSTAFVHSSGHGLVRYFYIIDAGWLGIMASGIFIFGLILIIRIITTRFGWKINLKFFSLFAAAFITIYLVYGFFHAQDIKVKNIDVSIRNLPKNWQGKKIVQISDVHLGAINTEKLMEKIVGLAEKENPDYAFITGDLLDGTGDGMTESLAPLKKLNAPIFYVLGNHETYIGTDKTLAAIKDTKIRLIRDEIINLDGVELIGADYPQRMERKDLLPLLEKTNPGMPSILLFHEPVGIDKAESFGVDLMLSGHTHNGQILPAKLFTYLIYKSYDYGQKIKNDLTIYTTSGAGTWGPPMRVGSDSEIVVIKLNKK